MTTITKNRIASVDFLKGLVMVLMALDHTRDYFHQTFALLDLTHPEHTYFSIYITRWITHFCAPAFSFLAGMSAFFVGRRKSKSQLSAFLIKRGFWLIFIELTIITFAWYFDIHFRNFDLAVIWSLGVSMLFLAMVIHLPKQAILWISLVIIFGHNLLDTVHFEGSIFWSILHESSFNQITESVNLNVIYPIVPWIGVMSLGFFFGSFYDKSIEPGYRKKSFNLIGVLSILVLLVVRGINIYGDPSPWESYSNVAQTLYSFFNLTKYPPSLLYLLATLSGTFFVLANGENMKGKIVDFFTIFGRVPFFFYILHLYLIRILAAFAAEVTGYGWELMVQTTFEINLKDFGFNLGIVYLIWIAIILMLYPLCKKFDHYKLNNKDKWWLSYL